MEIASWDLAALADIWIQSDILVDSQLLRARSPQSLLDAFRDEIDRSYTS